MAELIREAVRYTVLGATAVLPFEKRKAIDRWMRGREEYRKLQRADWVLVSWGKSGRTWLRVMLSRYYQIHYDLPAGILLGFDNLHRRNPRVPKVFFTHGNYLRDYTKHRDTKVDFYGKRIVLLVRDPRDITVSQFFQWKYRMRPWKMAINDYPRRGEDVAIHDFMMNPAVGLPRIIDYFNGWAAELPQLSHPAMVRYEDMCTDPLKAVTEILEATGTPGLDEHVREAIEYASYDNMKKLEKERFFRFSGARVAPADHKNPDSYKVRRAKVGGYRDYFDDDQIATIDQLVETRLNPIFGYSVASPSSAHCGGR